MLPFKMFKAHSESALVKSGEAFFKIVLILGDFDRNRMRSKGIFLLTQADIFTSVDIPLDNLEEKF